MIEVEVIYATPERQQIRRLRLAPGATLRMAIESSDLLLEFPEIDLAVHCVGVFGRLVPEDGVLADGDRVEIYRPLLADPKQARRTRARRAKRSS